MSKIINIPKLTYTRDDQPCRDFREISHYAISERDAHEMLTELNSKNYRDSITWIKYAIYCIEKCKELQKEIDNLKYPVDIEPRREIEDMNWDNSKVLRINSRRF